METEFQGKRWGLGDDRSLSVNGLLCLGSCHTTLQAFHMHSSLKNQGRAHHIKGQICIYKYAYSGSCLSEILLGELKIT